MRILLVKTGALGDVIRTTALAQLLKRRFAPCSLEWLVSEEAGPLLLYNPHIDAAHTQAGAGLRRRYDWIINLEENLGLARRIGRIRAARVSGVVACGNSLSYTEDTSPFFSMSLLNRDSKGSLREADMLKKRNRRTQIELWQDIFCQDTGAVPEEIHPLLRFTRGEISAARQCLKPLKGGRKIIALQTGAGARWPAKQHSEGYIIKLVRSIRSDFEDCSLLLLGGPSERARNARIKKAVPFPTAAVPKMPLRIFCAVISLCDAVITPDTLAMHAAIAADVPLIAAFGPTSPAEIAVPRNSAKLRPRECFCCYKLSCPKNIECMDRIPPVKYTNALKLILSKIPGAGISTRSGRLPV